MSDRRGFLRGLTALPLISGGAAITEASAAASPDPFPAYYREVNQVIAAIDAGRHDEATSEALFERWGELDRLASTSRPTTFAGAVACIEYARREHLQFSMIGEPSDGDVLMLALLDGALGVLKQMART